MSAAASGINFWSHESSSITKTRRTFGHAFHGPLPNESTQHAPPEENHFSRGHFFRWTAYEYKHHTTTQQRMADKWQQQSWFIKQLDMLDQISVSQWINKRLNSYIKNSTAHASCTDWMVRGNVFESRWGKTPKISCITVNKSCLGRCYLRTPELRSETFL